jgi:hypothetical protein
MEIASSYYHPGERWCDELITPDPMGNDPLTGNSIWEGDYSIRYCNLDEKTWWITPEEIPF